MTHPPKLWHELARGMQHRGDVEAAQRGLWRAAGPLGYTSTNARNGNYGEQTAVDVERFRAATGISGDRNQIGATLWAGLAPYVDELGMARFCDQPQAVTHPTPTAKQLPLEQGDKSKGVEACQRALWRALPSSGNARNGNYGDETAADVEAFRDLYRVNAGDDGKSIGGELWNVLTRWMDSYAVDLVHDWQPAQPPAQAHDAVDVALGQDGYVEGAGNHTIYGSWYGMDGQPWCAMFCTWCECNSTDKPDAFVKGSRYAYVPYVVDDARASRNGLVDVSASSAKRGDLVCFDWGDDGVADHIGLVVTGPGAGSSFHTIEGNTSPSNGGSQSNGGGVYQRTRYTSDVVCFARVS